LIVDADFSVGAALLRAMAVSVLEKVTRVPADWVEQSGSCRRSWDMK